MVDLSEIAYNNVNREFSLNEAKKILAGNEDVLKSAVLLNLNKIDENIAELLIYNLTNQSGPVRELSAYKLGELIKNYPIFFQDKKVLDTILMSLNDVNPNVVRFILPTLKYFDNKKYLFDNLLSKIITLYGEITSKPRRGKIQEHIFTKKCFKIYWSLEGINYLISFEPDIILEGQKVREDFHILLKNLCNIDEYTIREKIAQIVNLLQNIEFYDIKNKLNNDKNYFVKRQYREK